jgi:cytochrome c556
MARMGKWGTLAIVALSVTAFGSTVVAQDKTALVKDRQAFMKAQAADNKAINDYAKGMATKADAEKAIADLQARNPKILGLFVPGTSSTDMPGVSNAKAVVWTDHDKFAGVVATLKDLEAKQAALIKTGTPEEVGVAQANLGKNGCGACHGTFREKLPG